MTMSRLSEAIAAGEVTAQEVVRAHVDRIAATNPSVGAVTVTFADRSLELARKVDEDIAAGREVGPLAGVPFTVKENIDLTWSATTEGATFLSEAMPSGNATMVQRLMDAGAIPIGRGNMPDFGLRWDTDNDLFGRTTNPWDKNLVPGGSSAGDAVAVATGMTPLGLGNDYGGSLRLPANAAGVCALRTSAGRIPAPMVQTAPIPLSVQHFAVTGPIARSVGDLDLAFSIMHGADDRDPLSLTVPHPSGYDGPKRVAVTRDPLGWGVDDSVAEAIDAASEALAAAGWQVDEVEPPLIEESATLWRSLSSTENASLFEPGVLPGSLSDGATQYFRDNVAQSTLLDGREYGHAWARRYVIAAAWRAFQAEHPIVLGPVSAREPFPIGFDLQGPEATTELWRRHRLLVTVNFLGLPSLALPTGVGATGLPGGVQLIAPMHGEHVALAAGRDIEEALGASAPIDPR